MFLIHFNIRSLQKYIDELATYLAGFKSQPEIVAISETKLREGNIDRNSDLEGYSFVHSDGKTCAGGVGICIKNTLKYSVNLHSKIVLTNAEHLWIDILDDKVPSSIGVVYKHPDDSTAGMIDKFTDELNELFISLNNSKNPFYCLGDFNVNLMNISSNNAVRRYANMLISCNNRRLIDVPTRIGPTSSTLIDHLYTNDVTKSVVSGVLTNFDLSDHYAIFTIRPISKVISKNRQTIDYKIRDMTQFDQVKFLECLDWKLGPLFEATTTPVNELFEVFLATFAETVNQFALKRKATRKEKKLGLKPWVSRGFLKSIPTKNKLFRQLQKNRVNSVLHNKYKIYRNTLNRTLRMAKRIKSNLHYTRRITPKRVTSCGAHLRGLAPGLHSSEETSQRWRVVGDTVSI